MFIGHFGLSFAARPAAAPRAGLAALFAAAAFADVLWPLLVALGIERVRIDPGNTVVTPVDFVSYPYSHSLLTLVIWGLVFGLAYRAITKINGRVAMVLVLVGSYVANLMSGPPPSVTALIVTAVVGTVALRALARWVDRHRVDAPAHRAN